MNRIWLFLCFLCIPWAARGQAVYDWYYWFDNNDGQRVTGTSNDSPFNIDTHASHLDRGFHAFHIQVADKDGRYSPPFTRLFYHNGDTGIQQLHYWFDNDRTHTSAIPVNQGSAAVDVTGIEPGIHFINFQTEDDQGVMSDVHQACFYRQVIRDKMTWTYWFDQEEATKHTASVPTEVSMIDVSELSDGFHTIHSQIVETSSSDVVTNIFIKVPQTEGIGDMTCVCSIDDKLVAQQKVSTQGGILSWELNVDEIDVGLHKATFQAITPTGAASSIAERFFVRAVTSKELGNMKCIYAIDNAQTYVQAGLSENGLFHFNLDVTTLDDGLHRIAYMLIAENGVTTTQKTAFFMKIPIGGNGITEYWYWLNDQGDNNAKKVVLPESQDPLSLITLLPVESQPLRSSSFQFRMEQDQPVIYAKNDFHIRFYDASGRFTDATKQYVDESVKQEVEPVAELQATQTFDKVAENDIRWYTMQVAPGDTAAFRVSQAATVQVFAPSGKEVFNTSESASVNWSGIHTWEDGTYYVAVHDVTGSRNTMTLDYIHMDKYDVVDWDVHTVGNGGCSTITFKGNGFRDLYAVDLVIAPGDTIHSVDVGHESDAETSVTFDFTDVNLGKYDAVFHFTEDDKIVSNVVTVEEAVAIELATDVSFPSTFLNGTSTTYTVKITNMGNMTAYEVPIYTYLSMPFDGIMEKMELLGERIRTLGNSIYGDGINETILNFLKNENEKYGFLAYMIARKDDNNNKVGNGYFWADIPPYTTSTIVVTYQKPSNVLSAKFYVPTEFESKCNKTNESRRFPNRSSDCMERVQRCYPLLAETTGGIAYGGETTGGIAYGGETTGGIAYGGETTGGIAYGGETTGSVAFGEAGSESTGNVAHGGDGGILASRKMNVRASSSDNCIWEFTPIPNCPPNPNGGGGTSTPQPPYDPNDIYGYLSEAGSKFIADTVAKVNYTIEFENDTAFAQASAHTIVIRDTLDSRYFDLKSFLPTSVKIGERESFLDETEDVKTTGGVTSFLKTIDMRPEINAIAQVEGTYSQQTGIAEWRFTSLDPMTMEQTDDLMQGILPVNYNGTSGIGEVMFQVGVKPNKADGTEISNRAGIVFDYEETILTPTWTNIVDATVPESHVADVQMATDSTAAVRIAATDELSGPWRYNVYVQYGSGAWFLGAENVPIDSVARVKVYEGIDHGFYTLVTDSAGNVEQKEAAREFSFEVFAPQVDTNTKIELAQGWNWMSHNQQEALSVEALKPASARMQGQTEELIEDTRFGWMGDLEELLPTQMYKVQMDEPLTVQLSGRLFNAGFRSVPLYEGWNWLGYPVAHTMTPAEALAKLEAEEGDMLMGQDGLSTYADGQWTGTLLEMVPGLGYMYRSASDKNLFYNATAQASSRAFHSAQSNSCEMPENWTVDKRKYPNVMGVIAVLIQNQTVDESGEWTIGAFSCGECRGLSNDVGSVLMINVYGIGGEPIAFYAMNSETGEVLPVAETELFQANVLGTMQQPYTMHIGEATGIRDITPALSKGDGDIYDLQGRRVDGTSMQKGIYVTTIGKRTKTQKVIRR